MRRRLILVVLASLLVTAGCLAADESPDSDLTDAPSNRQASSQTAPTTATSPTAVAGPRATVVDVVDGDTIRVRLENGTRETVRLLGVDTPEVHGSNTPAEYESVPDTEAGSACLHRAGERASAYANDRLANETVTLVFDAAADRRGYYGRLLAYVYVDGESFNYALLTEGHARLYDSTFGERERYAAAERDARAAGRGLWSCADSTVTETPTTDGPLAVTEVHADAAGNDNGNLNDEYVTVRNVGERPLDLGGWTVTDAAGATYTFAEGTTLEPGATLTLYTGSGADTDTARYWGRGGAVWNNGGDTIRVERADGTLVVERSY